jgi:pilus assembly protein CpaB
VKQKNMLLVAVAVVCGLVAAVLTSQVAAGGRSQKEETVPVLIAAKDLPVGTWLPEDKISDFVTFKDVPKSQAPPEFISSEDMVKNKKTIRTMRKDDIFNPKDVSKSTSIPLPEGFSMITLPCTLDEGVAGFVQPGAKVHLLASIPSKKNQDRATVVTFMWYVLVLAVDGSASPSLESNSIPTMSMVSFAVKRNQWELLHGAKTRNCNMRLVLTNPKDSEKLPEDAATDQELWTLLADMDEKEKQAGDGGGKTPPAPENTKPAEDKVKLAVAREDLAAGTELTPELITEKFEMKEFTKPAPANGIENLRDYTGKFLTKDLAEGQFVPKSFLGKNPKTAPKVAPSDDTTNKEGDTTPAPKVEEKKEPEAPPVYHDVVIQTASGTRKLRYQVMPNGEYVFRGEAPATSYEPAPEDKKDEKKAPAPKAPEKKEEKPAAPAPKPEAAKPEAPAPDKSKGERLAS